MIAGKRRSLFVLVILTVCVWVIGGVYANPAEVIQPTAVALSGVSYDQVKFQPYNRNDLNFSIQAVSVDTPNNILDSEILKFIESTKNEFVASISPDPTVAGFAHQLRIVPRVDYAANRSYSITMQIDEYHPVNSVKTRYVSWVSVKEEVDIPILDKTFAKELIKTLKLTDNHLLDRAGQSIAYGLLPNYKIRLYASGPLEGIFPSPFVDISLEQFPSIKYKYKQQFFGSYPAQVTATNHEYLDKAYMRAQIRFNKEANCELESCIALTFDDGPVPPYTPKVLDILKSRNIKATFFEQGIHVDAHPGIVRRTATDGHEIENHTYNHPDLTKLHSTEALRREIDGTQQALARVGVGSKFLRPPYGAVNDTVKNSVNMPLILWNVDAQEWRSEMTPASMADSIVSQARPGAIVLLHDTKPISIDALPLVIDKLNDRGYRFVTVEKLLNIDDNAKGVFASK